MRCEKENIQISEQRDKHLSMDPDANERRKILLRRDEKTIPRQITLRNPSILRMVFHIELKI